MFLFRLLLLFFLGLMIRRIWLSITRARRPRPGSDPSQQNEGQGPAAHTGKPGSPITEQEIDDADFEEIP